MKKRAVKVLLPLLFSFCCVFSGFLSVDASAYTTYDVFPVDVPLRFEFWSGDTLFSYYFEPNDDNLYSLSNVQLNDVNSIYLNIRGSDFFSLPIDVSIFDYYFISSFYGEASDISNFTFYPNDIAVQYYDHNGLAYSYNKSDFLVYHTDTVLYKGFSTSCKIDFINNSVVGDIVYGGNGSLPAKLKYEAMFLALPKGLSSGDINAAIIAAINNQTNVLDNSIGQAADDIQQSIEDQYSGDPETEFSVDDVITQHNEKMGVLSFGSDVMLQFLDMFQSANVGTAELTLPGFNITVENVEYSVWPDYSFNFEQLNEWVPALMSVIRVMLPAFVWLMVLRYCINVFEKNFLSNGG